MKGNYRMTWERGYHWCHFRGSAEGYFAGVMGSFSRGMQVLDRGVLATRALVVPSILALVLGESRRSRSLHFLLVLISFITQQPFCPL